MRNNFGFPSFEEEQDNLHRLDSIKSICIFCNSTNVVDFSITIPTYKRVDQLVETIESALKQDTAINYEIIVVDNNPERGDLTEVLMNRYKENKNIAYYKNSENLGMGGNWNRCLSLANGNWVVLLHDDDKIEPSFLSEVKKIAMKHPNAGFIQTRKYSTKEPQGIPWKHSWYEYRKLTSLDAVNGAGIIGVPSGVAYRKTALDEMGGIYYDDLAAYGYYFHARMMKYYSCYKINKELTFYRVGTENASAKPEILEMWIDNDNFIGYSVLSRYLPDFIVMPYLSLYDKGMEQGIRKQWMSNFQIPARSFIRPYSSWREKISFRIVLILMAINHIKNILFR